MKIKELIKPNEFDLKGVELTLPAIYDKKNLNIGTKTTVKPTTVTVKDSKTGKIYGRRTFYQK